MKVTHIFTLMLRLHDKSGRSLMQSAKDERSSPSTGGIPESDERLSRADRRSKVGKLHEVNVVLWVFRVGAVVSLAGKSLNFLGVESGPRQEGTENNVILEFGH